VGSGRTELLNGLLLVEVGREGQGDLGKAVGAVSLLEGQRHRHLGPLEQPLAFGQQAINQPLEAGCAGVEDGADGIGSDQLQFAGNNRGEQGMLRFCTLRLAISRHRPAPCHERLHLRELGRAAAT